MTFYDLSNRHRRMPVQRPALWCDRGGGPGGTSGPCDPQQFQAEAPKFKLPEAKKDSGPSFGQVMKDTLGDFKRLPKDNTVPILALGATFAATAMTYDHNVSGRFDTAQSRSFKPGAILGGAQFQFGASMGDVRLRQTDGQLARAPESARVSCARRSCRRRSRTRSKPS